MQYNFGSGILWGTRNDIANGTPVRFGALQDVSIDFDGETKELYSQYQFPIDTARGKMKITGKAKLARMSTVQYNALFFGQSQTTGQKLTSYDEAATVPGTPYQVTVAQGATFIADLGVRLASTGEPLTLVASGPTTGQYTVATGGVYTFAAADTTKAMLFDYVYSAVTGFTVAGANLLMGSSPRWGATFTSNYEGDTTTLRLYSCITNKMGLATKIDDYTIPELDFSAFANAAGQVFEFSTTT